MIVRKLARPYGRALLGWKPSQARIRVRWYASEVDANESAGDASKGSILQGGAIGSSSQMSPQAQVPGFWGQQRQLDPDVASISQRHRVNRHSNETFGKYGGDSTKAFNPNHVITNPPSPSDLTPELLLASQTHLGHATSLWNPMNSRYIFGARDGIHIISLEETLAHLRRACQVVRGVTERGGLVLFVGTRPGQQSAIVQAAKLADGCHLFERWIAGSISNRNQILGALKKKMVDMHDEEIVVNEDSLLSLPALKPDLVVCLNPLENWVLLNECALESIPTIGVIDTDADPTQVTYPIPANDDSIRSTSLIASVLGRAAQEGNSSRRSMASEGKVLYEPLRLPANTVLGEPHKTVFNPEDTQVRYINKEGQIMSMEDIETAQRQGMLIDKSMLTIYNDYDGGDPLAEVVYRIDNETGHLEPEITKSGGGAGSKYDTRFEVPREDDNLTEASVSEKDLARQVNTGSAVAHDFEAIEQQLSSLANEMSSLKAELRSQQPDVAEGTMGLDSAVVTEFPADSVQAETGNDGLADVGEKDLIETAKLNPNSGLQSELNKEKKDESS